MLNEIIKKEIAILPEGSQEAVSDFICQLNDRISDEKSQLIFGHTRINKTIAHVSCCSLFVRESCLKNSALLFDLVSTCDLFSSHHREQYPQAIQQGDIESEVLLMAHLRQFRRREMVRIAWRDLAGWAELDETLRDLTALAETCIQFALDYLYQHACHRRGVPLSTEGKPINIIVLGMGKLGAWELNYSSDIDLIFAYAEDGQLQDRKETSYGEFFTRICRSLVKVLDAITVDGFVFRTDVRLRPFGDSGPMIMTFDGMENYYMTQAREWERYAMIKARQVAGDTDSGRVLSAMIKPFVYRRYLDYGAFEELRSIKVQITRELMRKDRMDNIKLGPGGIREIEFMGQAFQLIRGGQEPTLQQRGIITILSVLAELELMSQRDVDTLQASYCYLRRVENHIQQYQDRQTHDLPTNTSVQVILAHSMGHSEWQPFKQELDGVREKVHTIFGDVFSLSDNEQDQKKSMLIWEGDGDTALILGYIRDYGFLENEKIFTLIQSFQQSPVVKRLSVKGVGVLDRLMPAVLEAIKETDNQDETMRRLLVLFEAVVGRNIYLSLLAENKGALKQLIILAEASPWICEYLAQYPVLFDELLDTRSLYEPLEKQALAEQLKVALSRINEGDAEQLMIELRQFKHLNVLRVAATDIMGAIPLMVVSDYLTAIAEVVLDEVVDRAWKMLVDKHGCPEGQNNEAKGFAILGLGKLGGFELGYGSDLDMIFLYDCPDNQAMTKGEKPLGYTQFYVRLGQKVRHILETKMLAGLVYDVDLRLRPSGDSGLLVTHIESYEEYLKNEAWTWEHQALVRGRFITGDVHLQTQFDAIRQKILSLPREINDLKKDVREMREKMRDALAPKNASIFGLKQSKGGIADIEFIVQFGVLANAQKNIALTTCTDNINLLDKLAGVGFVSEGDAAFLQQAYCQYRDYGHRQVLQGKRAEASQDAFVAIRTRVEQLWQDLMEDGSELKAKK